MSKSFILLLAICSDKVILDLSINGRRAGSNVVVSSNACFQCIAEYHCVVRCKFITVHTGYTCTCVLWNSTLSHYFLSFLIFTQDLYFIYIIIVQGAVDVPDPEEDDMNVALSYQNADRNRNTKFLPCM